MVQSEEIQVYTDADDGCVGHNHTADGVGWVTEDCRET